MRRLGAVLSVGPLSPQDHFDGAQQKCGLDHKTLNVLPSVRPFPWLAAIVPLIALISVLAGTLEARQAFLSLPGSQESKMLVSLCFFPEESCHDYGGDG
ncbi:hypothetical protein Lferr_0073 [Acidithiobacillus ferrooxidans ATCC 53993]|jgi:hypothetical protein|nr:hypothetical protein Lferr_0073 [Acidithiobacillus ferrooxidans ATCC 53993]BDB12754.1 hypothetical protein ANFP_00740 [Acidithiobacillus ferrooxidans]